MINPDATQKERETAQEMVTDVAAVFDDGDWIEHSVVEGTDVVETIVELTDESDLTLIGATREGLFQQLLFGGLPEQIGQRAHNTVIMAKRNLDIRSRLSRWFKRRNNRPE